MAEQRRRSRKATPRKRIRSETKPKAVRIIYADPDRVPISYANNFYVNHNEHEFVLTLAEVAPPPTLHMTEEELAALESIEAIVTARIAMSPSRFKDVVTAMSENYMKWEQTYGGSEPAE